MLWVEDVKLLAEGSYPVRLRGIVSMNEPPRSNYGVNLELWLRTVEPDRILGPYTKTVPLRPGEGTVVVEWSDSIPVPHYAWLCAWSMEGQEDYTCSYPVYVSPARSRLLEYGALGILAGGLLGVLLRRRGS